MRLIPRGNEQQTGYEILMGETPDVSPWLGFGFWDRVWYWDEATRGDQAGRKLVRWLLGVAQRVGGALCYWIMMASGKVIARTTVQHVIRSEQLGNEISDQIAKFDEALSEQMDDSNFILDDLFVKFYLEDEPLLVDDHLNTPTDEEYGDCFSGSQIEAEEIYTEEMFDKYVGAQLIFDCDGERKFGTVTKRAKDFNGRPIGSQHATNPIFDAREYVVEFADGVVRNFTANVIAENMISQVDSEGHDYLLMKEITDHRSNERR